MKPPKLTRPTTLFERASLWLVLVTLGLILVACAAWSKFNSILSLVASRGNTFTLVTVLGIATVALILLTYFYSLRKRNLQEMFPGTMMAWLQVHVFVGLLSLAVVFVHIWVASFAHGWTTGKLALLVFALLVLSGAAWRIVYVMLPPRVAKDVGNLSIVDTTDKSRTLRVEIEKVLAGKSPEFQQAARNRLERGATERKGGGPTLTAGEESDWNRFVRRADRLDQYARRAKQQKRYAAFLQGWKQLHIPLSIIFGILVVVHIWDTLHVGNIFLGDQLAGLPPASACATCHGAITDEWKLAMHSQSQSGPIVVAQTDLALQKFPAFGRACNNCHSPIGTALTGSATLPLDTTNQFRAHPNGTVVDDGVNCVVCHTLATAPEERRGMSDNFPVVQGSANQFAHMFGPPLGNVASLPNARHDSGVGFMTDNVESSQLCGACHNVKVDINGDGSVTEFPGSEGTNTDSDGNHRLDQNELEFDVTGKKLKDLVLQTTFDEWQDYAAFQQLQGKTALGCVDCHMPTQAAAPLVDSAPGSLLGQAPDRTRHSHDFIGVDYNLTPGYYDQPGMPPNGLEHILEDRAALLRSAMSLSVQVSDKNSTRLTVTVTVDSKLEGHNFPTGFAFARQLWLEVFAQTDSGTQVCLADFPVKGQLIKADCASGHLDSPQTDLKTCDPLAVAQLGLKPSKNDELIQLNPDSVAPLTGCDPWLTNFQKILTDGDPDGDGIFTEVPYQSLLADIVKTRVRVSDQQAMDALNNTVLIGDKPHDSASYKYIFNVADVHAQNVTITAIMHFRHLPPYFIRALNGGYPNGITADDLLKNLAVTDIETVKTEPIALP